MASTRIPRVATRVFFFGIISISAHGYSHLGVYFLWNGRRLTGLCYSMQLQF